MSGSNEYNLQIHRDLSLLSSLSHSPKSPDEYPELVPFIKTEKSFQDALSYIDGADMNTVKSDEEESVSIATELIEDAADFLDDLRDVTVDAGELIKEEVLQGIEVLTKPENLDADYSWVDGLWGLISAFTFVVDLASDVFLSSTMNEDPAAKYWSEATLLLAVIPLLVQNLFSIYWYWFDDRRKKFNQHGHFKTRPALWLMRIFCHLMLLAPVLRQLDIIYYGIKSTKQPKNTSIQFEMRVKDQTNLTKNGGNKKAERSFFAKEERRKLLRSGQGARISPSLITWDYRELWLHAEGDAATLDLIGTLLQDAPQMVLQLYVMTKTFPSFSVHAKMSHTMIVQLGSVSVSVITMAWTISGFVRAVRLPSSGLRSLSPVEILLLTLSHFTSITPQVSCFALLASKHLVICLVFILCHWLVATITISFQLLWLPATTVRRATFTHDLKSGTFAWVDDIVFSAVFGIAFLFTFVDVDGAAPLLQAVLFCLGRLAEEIVFLSIWFLSTSRGSWWHCLPFALAPVFFFMSLLFSIAFYKMVGRKTVCRSSIKQSENNSALNGEPEHL